MSQVIADLALHNPARHLAFREFYSGRNLLITGGLGFIGSTLAAALVALDAKVCLIDAMNPEYGGNLANIADIRHRVQVNFSDIRDRSSMTYLVRDVQGIFNLAGTLSHVDSMRDPFTDLEINCVSQLSILETLRHTNPTAKIVFAGTRGQYGRGTGAPLREDSPMRPVDVNGINNIAGESYHILYNDVYGIPACSLRLTNTYGPRHQMKHHRQGVLNWFLRQILDGQTVRLYGDGSQVRDTNYVDDVVEAFLLAMMSDATNGQVYNLGGEAISLLKFVELAMEIHGGGNVECVPFPEESKAIEVGNFVADTGKIQQELNWSPTINLREGIERTLKYYAAHRADYWSTKP